MTELQTAFLKNLNKTQEKIYAVRTSGQDGELGRHTVPPHTTTTRRTSNLKTKNNQD